jgi:hypothetical protein
VTSVLPISSSATSARLLEPMLANYFQPKIRVYG